MSSVVQKTTELTAEATSARGTTKTAGKFGNTSKPTMPMLQVSELLRQPRHGDGFGAAAFTNLHEVSPWDEDPRDQLSVQTVLPTKPEHPPKLFARAVEPRLLCGGQHPDLACERRLPWRASEPHRIRAAMRFRHRWHTAVRI